MYQRLIKVENEQLVEATLFKLELDLLLRLDGWELFYLLNNIDRLDDLN